MNLELPSEALPHGWTARRPDERDIPALALLRAAVAGAATGSGTPDAGAVSSEVLGSGSWTRRQVAVLDGSGRARAWAATHDRAAGRSLIHVTIDPDLEAALADPLAASLFAWCERAAAWFSALRDRADTQLDTGAYAEDPRQQRWLESAGYSCTRRWLQMTRRVEVPHDAVAAPPSLRTGVEVRRVRRHPNGLPLAEDVQLVHWVLEKSFEDHFNAYRESFPEFAHRLQEDPGHAWDHWWLATVRDETGAVVPGGAVVCTTAGPDSGGVHGTYVEYIGVHRDARGRGVAKGLLQTVIADAAVRGRNRVGLEVDASSPTGADRLYAALGWRTSYVTESWHRDLIVHEGDHL